MKLKLGIYHGVYRWRGTIDAECFWRMLMYIVDCKYHTRNVNNKVIKTIVQYIYISLKS